MTQHENQSSTKSKIPRLRDLAQRTAHPKSRGTTVEVTSLQNEVIRLGPRGHLMTTSGVRPLLTSNSLFLSLHLPTVRQLVTTSRDHLLPPATAIPSLHFPLFCQLVTTTGDDPSSPATALLSLYPPRPPASRRVLVCSTSLVTR